MLFENLYSLADIQSNTMVKEHSDLRPHPATPETRDTEIKYCKGSLWVEPFLHSVIVLTPDIPAVERGAPARN